MAPHRLDALRSVVSFLRRHAATLTYKIFFGYGRHDAALCGRFGVPVHRTDAELRDLCIGGAR